MEAVLKSFFKDEKASKIYTFDEFMEYSRKNVNKEKHLLSDEDKKYKKHRDINLHRINRVNKIFKPNEFLVSKIKNITNEQTWLIVTEDWCGDSAQTLGYFIKYSEYNSKIKVRIILRDENLTAIDNYFTEGNPRSIPKIVGLDKNGKQLFIWGPRPKFAQDLVQQLKAEGYSKEEFNEKLHLWYGRNRGKELEKELITLFSNI